MITVNLTFAYSGGNLPRKKAKRSPSPSSLRAASPVPLLSPSRTMESEREGPLAFEPSAQKLEVAVLIAMPSPYRPQAWASNGTSRTREEDSGEDVPDVVFGVAEVPLSMNVREETSGPAERNELE